MSYNNKLLESKTNSLTIAFLKIERLEINLTKEVKGLYAENYRILMKKKKKLKKTEINGKISAHSLEIILLKSIAPKAIYRSDSVSIWEKDSLFNK